MNLDTDIPSWADQKVEDREQKVRGWEGGKV